MGLPGMGQCLDDPTCTSSLTRPWQQQRPLVSLIHLLVLPILHSPLQATKLLPLSHFVHVPRLLSRHLINFHLLSLVFSSRVANFPAFSIHHVPPFPPSRTVSHLSRICLVSPITLRSYLLSPSLVLPPLHGRAFTRFFCKRVIKWVGKTQRRSTM
jgi:hypothetical protein